MKLNKNVKIGFYAVLGLVLSLAVLCWMESPYNPIRWLEELTAPKIMDPEFERIMQVMEKYKQMDFDVVFEGRTFKIKEVLSRANRFFFSHYEPGMKAEDWVREHCYRSKHGEIIYFKYADGSTQLMRDVFLEELSLKK